MTRGTWKAVASDSRELEEDLPVEPHGEAPPLLLDARGVAVRSSPASSMSTLPMPCASDVAASPEPPPLALRLHRR